MHRRGRQERRQRHARRPDAAVGKDDDIGAVVDGGLGLTAQLLERGLEAGAVVGREGGIERLRLELHVADLGDRADFLQVLVGQDRLAHLEPLFLRQPLEVEQVRPRPDERHQAHHQLLADRIDRRVGHLREVLLEIREQQLGLIGQRRNRRVVAHGTDRFLAVADHRLHQHLQVFLRVAERLLTIQQRHVGAAVLRARGLQVLEHDLRAIEPAAVRVSLGEPGLELLVVDDAALFEIDEQHLAWLQPPLADDLLFRNRQHAGFRSHDDALVGSDQPARRPQPVAVERGADLPSVGEGDRRRPVPGLHEGRVIFVESAPLLVHKRIARPGLGDHGHHRLGERIAALHEELERVVETGRVRLAFIGDRPELLDVVAQELGSDRSLAGRHPVVIAAQRIDLAVVRDHPVGVCQRPGREGVGGEALVHERERALEVRLVQVRVVGQELVGQEHALVDDGAARQRNRIIARRAPLALVVEAAGDGLAQHIEPPLEIALGLGLCGARDEHLHVHGLGRLHRETERRIVGRHVAPAENLHALARHFLDIGLDDLAPPRLVVRHEQRTDRVLSRLRQREAEPLGFACEKLVRNLHQDPGAVAGARIGADRAAVLEVAQDREPVLDDLVRLASLDVGDEADAAGVMLAERIEHPGGCRKRVGGIGLHGAGLRTSPLLRVHRSLPSHRHRPHTRYPSHRAAHRAPALRPFFPYVGAEPWAAPSGACR